MASSDDANSIALQGDKIIVAGYCNISHDFALARYTADGSIGLFLWSEWKSNH